ncbi:hypothetical protein AB6A40_009222 [Gnathostoma spinigerum]|uniref:Mitochondrial carrier protein n=1 Tax=Gnathostoma spinigerum TaxID=75299 RepID=A0ABD6EZF9_9BILA
MVSWAINYPVDLVKTLFQADDKYSHYSDAIRDTYRTSGFRGFFNGIGTCLLRAFPSNAATFFAVEWTYRLLLELQHWSAKRKTQPHRECILCSCPTSLRYSTMHHFWGTNALPLPEAGSTYIDPMIHYYRFI